jgi:hypothetical protein
MVKNLEVRYVNCVIESSLFAKCYLNLNQRLRRKITNKEQSRNKLTKSENNKRNYYKKDKIMKRSLMKKN